MKERKLLVSLGLLYTVFSVLQYHKTINLYHFPILPLLQDADLHRCVISSFPLRSKFFHFTAIVGVYQYFAVVTN
jgi:hypothetical protein